MQIKFREDEQYGNDVDAGLFNITSRDSKSAKIINFDLAISTLQETNKTTFLKFPFLNMAL